MVSFCDFELGTDLRRAARLKPGPFKTDAYGTAEAARGNGQNGAAEAAPLQGFEPLISEKMGHPCFIGGLESQFDQWASRHLSCPAD